MNRFEFNDDALAEITEGVVSKLQPEVDTAAQDIIRQVNSEMSGQAADDVLETLRARMRKVGFMPNDEGLRPYAQSISDGTLED
jgi:hypothetical protein